jgi:hypothetical protein
MSKIEVNTVDTQCGTNLTVGAACKSVTVAGNDVRSNAYKAADGGSIISQSGTTITIGASGDTVSLASGASQSGFGRTGTVDWQTGSIKTANFTAASGEGYFCNTTGGAFTLTLPSSPSAGDIVALKDYAGTFSSNALTIGRNGSNLDSSAVDSVRNTDNESLTLVYVDGTQGWKSVEEGTGFIGKTFITATGGTITTSGNFKIHTFTGPGTFTVCSISSAPACNVVDYLVVAGGGSGGKGTSSGGGGGAGGMRFSATTYCSPSPLKAPAGITVSAQAYPITVGGGGSTVPGAATGPSGNNSVFSTITSTGGGGGGGGPEASQPPRNGQPGGSGGGSTYGPGGTAPAVAGGSGNTPPVSPSQGNNGGVGAPQAGTHAGGGGGGFTAAGVNGANPQTSGQGAGGAGLAIDITGSPVAYAGGGGGGIQSGSPDNAGPGGTGGGGGGGKDAGGVQNGTAGTANTGGGGGGSGPGTGAAGGSGIVVIRYKYQ